ncbi:hypothetical protein [Streptomyces acidicola]|nr:hypothetical protein [Streptomyces acidicola]
MQQSAHGADSMQVLHPEPVDEVGSGPDPERYREGGMGRAHTLTPHHG